jgi:hypothetical protein
MSSASETQQQEVQKPTCGWAAHSFLRLLQTNDLRIMRTQAGSDAFAKFSTLLLFSTLSKSVDLIRSAW